jgi:hypothetical protein
MSSNASSTTTTVSVAEFARMVGRSRQAIHELIQRGKLTAIGGRIHPALGRVEFEANVRPRTSPLGQERGERDAAPSASPASYSDARAREVTARAQLAELELARQQRHLLQAADVYAAVEDAAATVRSIVQEWRSRMPPHIAAFGGDEDQIAAHLGIECDRLLQRLADKFTAMARNDDD